MNTEVIASTAVGINHVEGGWPKDVSYNEPDQTARHRKKIEREEFYASTVKILAEVAYNILDLLGNNLH